MFLNTYSLGGKTAAIIHTLMSNLFDWPAGNVPFGKESGKRINEYDTEGDFLLKWALEVKYQHKIIYIS